LFSVAIARDVENNFDHSQNADVKRELHELEDGEQ